MDRIRLTGLRVWAHHGVLAHEAELGQQLVLDVAVEVDLAASGRTDALEDTVDYAALAEAVVAAAGQPRAQLLETVAARVARTVLDADRRIAAVEVTLRKPAAPLRVAADEVAVELRRSR